MEKYDEREIPVTAIKEPPRPHRLNIDPDELARLADDIAANGLHQAIGVRAPDPDGLHELIYGHRRYLAMKVLHRDVIRAKVYPSDADALQVRMAENEMRADLNPIEQAHVCAEFRERGEPLAAIARHFRRSIAWVTGRLDLLALPPDLQEALSDGVITTGVAYALAEIDHAGYRLQMIAEAARSGASAPVANAWAAHYLADRERLIRNQVTIEQFIATRDTFKVMTECVLCNRDVELMKTRTIRACEPCMTAFARELAQEGRQGA